MKKGRGWRGFEREGGRGVREGKVGKEKEQARKEQSQHSPQLGRLK